MVSKESRSKIREAKHRRMRNRISGTAERPRLAVFRSNNHMYVQIIDDTEGKTLLSASTNQKEVKAELEKTNDVEAAKYLGSYIGGLVSGGGLFHFGGSWIPLGVVAVACLAMAGFLWLYEKKNAVWVESFSIAGSMLIAMAAAVAFGAIA